MKKEYFLMILSVLFITLGSCSSDDSGDSDDGDVNEDLLIGEWRLTRETDNDTEDPLDETYPSNCQNIWVFTQTTFTTNWDDDCDGDTDETFSQPYEVVNGNRLLIDGQSTGEDGERAEITRLTSSELRIRVIEPEFDDEPEYIITFELERL